MKKKKIFVDEGINENEKNDIKNNLFHKKGYFK